MKQTTTQEAGMYKIKQLQQGQWIPKAQYSNRNAALKRISQIRRAVIQMNGNSIDGPYFLMTGKSGQIIA